MSIRKRTWSSKDGLEKTAWVVDYVGPDGKRHLKTFSRKKEAVDWWENTAHKITEGTYVPERASVTVAEAADDWLRRTKLERRERSTYEQYKLHIDRHILPRIGGVRLSRLTRPTVEEFRDNLLEGLSRPMARKVLNTFKSIVKEAQRRGKVAQNVTDGVSIRMHKRHTRKLEVGRDVPSPNEIQKIIAVLPDRWRPVLLTAIFTGLRASELRGLSWDCVDLEAKVIRVRQRADRWKKIGPLKSHAADRDVPLPPNLVNTLREWRLRCPKGDLNLVFPTGIGTIETTENIYRRGLGATLRTLDMVDNTGKQKYGLHSLRHFYASWLINQGFKPKRIQTLLGHHSIRISFDVYGHWFADEEDDHERLAAGELQLVG